MGRLTQDEIIKLHQVALMCSLDRKRLMSGIDKGFVAGLRLATDTSSQHWEDLHALNDTEVPLLDGSDPLVTWLENAKYALGLRREADQVERVLRRLRPEAPAAAGTSATGARSTPSHPAPPTPSHTWKKGAVKIYFAAAPEERREAAELEKHLAPLKRAGTVDVWSRHQNEAGAEVSETARRKLAEADIVLLFVSKSFIASDTTFDEATEALAQRERTKKRVVPLLVKECTWKTTPFGGLTPLPGSERFIASYSDSDSAYTEVVAKLGAMAQDLLSQQKTTNEDPYMGMLGTTPQTADEAMVGRPITEVFSLQGVPKHLYVEPAEFRRIRQSTQVKGRLLVVEGPSQIGKTTAVVLALQKAQLPYKKYDMNDAGERAAFLTIVKGRQIRGHVLGDNAQELSDTEMADVARSMRVYAEHADAQGKVTLLGYSKTSHRLIASQRDLAGRMDLVPLEPQPDERIRAFVERAERIANVRFLDKESIVREAQGSFQLAQQICFFVASKQLDDVPRRRKDVERDLMEVRREITTTMEREFDDLLLSFAKADEKTPTPGACLTLLWQVAPERGRVSIGKAKLKHSHLAPAFDWIETGALEAWLVGNSLLAPVLQISAGRLSSQDPRLLYYLRDLDWVDLGGRAGLVVDFTNGEYRVVPERQGNAAPAQAAAAAQAAQGPPAAPGAFLREAPYPFWNPAASTLRDLLVRAYQNVAAAQNVALSAGILLGVWNPNTAPYYAWNSLLEVAAAQGKLPKLVEVVLADETIAFYHDAIRECVNG